METSPLQLMRDLFHFEDNDEGARKVLDFLKSHVEEFVSVHQEKLELLVKGYILWYYSISDSISPPHVLSFVMFLGYMLRLSEEEVKS